MKKKFLHSLVAMLLFVCLMSFTACSINSPPQGPKSPPEYSLHDKLVLWEIQTGDSLSYSIDMRMEKRCRYRGTSSYEGLVHVSLYTEIDGVTYTLKAEPVPITADISWVTLKKGQKLKIEREYQTVVWNKEAEEYVPAPAGLYHAKFSFFEVEHTLENVVLVVPEST